VPKSFRIFTLSGLLLVIGLGLSNAQAAEFVTANGKACLDVSAGNTANFTKVQTYPCHGGFPQQWMFRGFFIYGVGTTQTSAKCLDVKFGGTADGTFVDLYDCHPGLIQQWYFYNGQLINLNSYKCLDVGNGAPNTQATIQTCNGSAGQQWWIHS
jgi:Ricin-type beta-trefoil lectin domain